METPITGQGWTEWTFTERALNDRTATAKTFAEYNRKGFIILDDAFIGLEALRQLEWDNLSLGLYRD